MVEKIKETEKYIYQTTNKEIPAPKAINISHNIIQVGAERLEPRGQKDMAWVLMAF